MGDTDVWATQFFTHPDYIFPAAAYRGDKHVFVIDFPTRGDPLDPEKLPTHIRLTSRKTPRQDIIAIEGMAMVVSAKLAELLSGFDLGPAPTPEEPAPRRVELHPVPLYDMDGETKLMNAALLQVSNHKDGWLPEQSRILKHHEEWGTYSLAIGENSLTVDSRALTGADLWRDRRTDDVVFVSGRLMRAMREAGIKRLDEFYPCRMAEA